MTFGVIIMRTFANFFLTSVLHFSKLEILKQDLDSIWLTCWALQRVEYPMNSDHLHWGIYFFVKNIKIVSGYRESYQ